jgi:hypothetical protein
LDISDSVLLSPSKSLRKLAQEEGIDLATAHKTVRNNGTLEERVNTERYCSMF